jgi:hypothetical protein
MHRFDQDLHLLVIADALYMVHLFLDQGAVCIGLVRCALNGIFTVKEQRCLF